MTGREGRKANRTTFREALEQLDVHALRFVFQFSSTTFKIFWFALFIGGFLAAGYYIYQIISEFQRSPTATKVSAVEQSQYEYPAMYFCTRYNLDITKLERANLSDTTVTYALSLVDKVESAHAVFLQLFGSKYAQSELEQFIKANNFKTYANFYKWLAFNLSEVVASDSSVLDIHHFQVVFSANPTYDGNPTSYRLCYRAQHSPYTPNSGDSFYLEYEMKQPAYSSRLPSNLDSDFMVISEDPRVVLEKDRFNIRRNRITTIRLSAKKYINLDSATHRCKTEREASAEHYSHVYCRHKCYSQAVQICHNCTVLMEETELEDVSSGSLCTWLTNPNQTVTCPHGRQHYQTCAQLCLYPCQYFTYEYSVTLAVINRTHYNDDRIAVWLYYEVDDGLLVYEEIPTYTWASMVSNIGGQLGLWTGASILTLLELIYLLTHVSLENWRAKKNDEDAIAKTPKRKDTISCDGIEEKEPAAVEI